MKKIPNIDLDELYWNHYRNYDGGCYRGSFLNLVTKLQEESNPVKFREELMAIIQLYFDGIVEDKKAGLRKDEKAVSDEWMKQKEILDRLFMAGKDFIGAFYSGEDADLHEIGKIVSADAVEIAKNSGEKTAKSRYLEGNTTNVQKFGLYLQDELERTGPFDSLVCVASGGFEPSFLAMYITESEHIIPIRYSRRSRYDNEVKIPKGALEDYASSIKGKKVLVIEDWVNSGKSLAEAMKYCAQMGASEVYGIAVRRNYSSELPSMETQVLCREDPFMCKLVGIKNQLDGLHGF